MADDSTSVISSPILPISDVAEHEIPLPADSVAVDYKAFPDSIHLELDRNMRTLVEGDSIVEEGDSTAIIPEGMIPVDNCTNCATDSISPDSTPIISCASSIPTPNARYGCRHCFPALGSYTTADTGNCRS